MKLYMVDGNPEEEPEWMEDLKVMLNPEFELTASNMEADMCVTGVGLEGTEMEIFAVYSLTKDVPMVIYRSVQDVARHLNDLLPIPTPKLTIIRGLPGSGKTTKGLELVETQASTDHFEADMYMVGIGGYCFDRETLQGAHDWCINQTKESLIHGINVVVANTFSRTWEYQRYLDLGYPTEVITMTGTYPNIHGVPKEAIDRMKERWEQTPEGYEKTTS
jgi:hypothetical protein